MSLLRRIPRTRPIFPRPPQTRTIMASTPPRKHEYLIIVPDKPGAQQIRLQVREQHLAHMTAVLKAGAGDFKEAGGLLNSVPASGDSTTWDFFGSMFVMLGHSREHVLQHIAEDVYTTAGVWDLEKAQVYPLKCAFRIP